MKDYIIRFYGDPVLREKSREITKIDDGIIELASDMLRVMNENAGAGLAAQQIGRTERICVIDISKADSREDAGPLTCVVDVEMPLVMINPEITATNGEQKRAEGCLSFPDIYVTLRRHEEVTAKYTDLQNRVKTIRVRGFLARAVQHELDHLNGVLMVDHMSAVQKAAIAAKLRKIKAVSRSKLKEIESA